MFTGYDPLRLQARDLDDLGRDVRRSPARCTCRRSASSTRARCRRRRRIEIAIWAAVGGRGTLIGPIVGAFFVNGAKSWFTAGVPGVLAVLPRRAVHRGDAVPAATASSACCARRKEAPRMTPDLMQAGARTRAGRRRSARRARAGRSGGRETQLRPRASTRRARLHARRDPVPRRHHRQLRRLQGAERAVADRSAPASCAASSARTAPARRR